MDLATRGALKTGWIAQADPALPKAFMEAERVRNFGDGAMIYTFEQDQICLWGVVLGIVRISVTMNEQEPKLVHCAGPGFWFGEVPVIKGRTGAVEAVASGGTRLCAIDRSVIVEMTRRTPGALRLAATFAVLNELVAIGARENLMIRDSRKRLVAVLLRLSGLRNAFQGTAPVQSVPATQVGIAEASTLSRSSAAVILKDLTQRGMIRAEYHRDTRPGVSEGSPRRVTGARRAAVQRARDGRMGSGSVKHGKERARGGQDDPLRATDMHRLQQGRIKAVVRTYSRESSALPSLRFRRTIPSAST